MVPWNLIFKEAPVTKNDFVCLWVGKEFWRHKCFDSWLTQILAEQETSTASLWLFSWCRGCRPTWGWPAKLPAGFPHSNDFNWLYDCQKYVLDCRGFHFQLLSQQELTADKCWLVSQTDNTGHTQAKHRSRWSGALCLSFDMRFIPYICTAVASFVTRSHLPNCEPHARFLWKSHHCNSLLIWNITVLFLEHPRSASSLLVQRLFFLSLQQ